MIRRLTPRGRVALLQGYDHLTLHQRYKTHPSPNEKRKTRHMLYRRWQMKHNNYVMRMLGRVGE